MEDTINKTDENNQPDDLCEFINKGLKGSLKRQKSGEFSHLAFIERLIKINNESGNDSSHIIMDYLTIIAKNTIEIKYLIKTALLDIKSK